MSNNISADQKKIPKVILIGTGRFGLNHLRVLKDLERNNIIELYGVVVRNKKNHKDIESKFKVRTYNSLSTSILKKIDAVDIVTPPETHYRIVKKCLPFVDVFVEKPLAMNEKQALDLGKLARRYKRTLTVGHIFRFHPVSEKLLELVSKKNMPIKIEGCFVNPATLDQGREPSFEFLHLFDVVDFLWGLVPGAVFSRRNKGISIVDVRYGEYNNANFILGCEGNEKKRTLKFTYPDCIIQADYIESTIVCRKGKTSKIYRCPIKQELLYRELFGFIGTIKGVGKNIVDANIGARIVSIADRAVSKPKKLPTVAIIGGGIFGTSIAAELGKSCLVTIFEKNSELMQEGTFANCLRHHYGYHYPRSDATVIDIQNSRKDFEKIYKKALVYSHKTYYGLAKNNSYVSAQEFLTFCKKHKLTYEKKFPPNNVLARNEMSLSIRVPESNYNFEILRNLTKARLDKFKNIKILYNTKVTNCSIDVDGRKTVTFIENETPIRQNKFDYVINATYANINRFSSWLSFGICPIRIDRTEVLIVKLPMPPFSLTVIDGPFACLMPDGNPNEFTLYHVKESILDRYVSKDGLVKGNDNIKSNQKSILKESMKFFPILKDAVVIESRITNRGVLANHEHDDSRVADIIEHGFGCWSILSGKILSSVTTGIRLAEIIKRNLNG